MCVDLRLSTSATLLLGSFQEVTPSSYPQQKADTSSVAIMSFDDAVEVLKRMNLTPEDLRRIIKADLDNAMREEKEELMDKIAKLEDELEELTVKRNYLLTHASPEVLAQMPSFAQLAQQGNPSPPKLRLLKEKAAADPGVQP